MGIALGAADAITADGGGGDQTRGGLRVDEVLAAADCASGAGSAESAESESWGPVGSGEEYGVKEPDGPRASVLRGHDRKLHRGRASTSSRRAAPRPPGTLFVESAGRR